MAAQNVIDYPEIVKRLDQFGLLADPTVLSEALREFDDGLAEQLVAVEAGIGAQDRRAIERAAHRIAGSCLTLGASRLGAHAADLERSAPNDPVDRLRERSSELALEISSVRDFVARLLASPPNPATIRRGR